MNLEPADFAVRVNSVPASPAISRKTASQKGGAVVLAGATPQLSPPKILVRPRRSQKRRTQVVSSPVSLPGSRASVVGAIPGMPLRSMSYMAQLAHRGTDEEFQCHLCALKTVQCIVNLIEEVKKLNNSLTLNKLNALSKHWGRCIAKPENSLFEKTDAQYIRDQVFLTLQVYQLESELTLNLIIESVKIQLFENSEFGRNVLRCRTIRDLNDLVCSDEQEGRLSSDVAVQLVRQQFIEISADALVISISPGVLLPSVKDVQVIPLNALQYLKTEKTCIISLLSMNPDFIRSACSSIQTKLDEYPALKKLLVHSEKRRLSLSEDVIQLGNESVKLVCNTVLAGALFCCFQLPTEEVMQLERLRYHCSHVAPIMKQLSDKQEYHRDMDAFRQTHDVKTVMSRQLLTGIGCQQERQQLDLAIAEIDELIVNPEYRLFDDHLELLKGQKKQFLHNKKQLTNYVSKNFELWQQL